MLTHLGELRAHRLDGLRVVVGVENRRARNEHVRARLGNLRACGGVCRLPLMVSTRTEGSVGLRARLALRGDGDLGDVRGADAAVDLQGDVVAGLVDQLARLCGCAYERAHICKHVSKQGGAGAPRAVYRGWPG